MQQESKDIAVEIHQSKVKNEVENVNLSQTEDEMISVNNKTTEEENSQQPLIDEKTVNNFLLNRVVLVERKENEATSNEQITEEKNCKAQQHDSIPRQTEEKSITEEGRVNVPSNHTAEVLKNEVISNEEIIEEKNCKAQQHDSIPHQAEEKSVTEEGSVNVRSNDTAELLKNEGKSNEQITEEKNCKAQQYDSIPHQAEEVSVTEEGSVNVPSNNTAEILKSILPVQNEIMNKCDQIKKDNCEIHESDMKSDQVMKQFVTETAAGVNVENINFSLSQFYKMHDYTETDSENIEQLKEGQTVVEERSCDIDQEKEIANKPENMDCNTETSSANEMMECTDTSSKQETEFHKLLSEDNLKIFSTLSAELEKPGSSDDIVTASIPRWMVDFMFTAMKASTENRTVSDTTKKEPSKTPKSPNQFLVNVEKQIVKNKLDPYKLPLDIWNSLKNVASPERRQFLRSMKKKYGQKKLNNANISNLNEPESSYPVGGNISKNKIQTHSKQSPKLLTLESKSNNSNLQSQTINKESAEKCNSIGTTELSHNLQTPQVKRKRGCKGGKRFKCMKRLSARSFNGNSSTETITNKVESSTPQPAYAVTTSGGSREVQLGPSPYHSNTTEKFSNKLPPFGNSQIASTSRELPTFNKACKEFPYSYNNYLQPKTFPEHSSGRVPYFSPINNNSKSVTNIIKEGNTGSKLNQPSDNLFGSNFVSPSLGSKNTVTNCGRFSNSFQSYNNQKSTNVHGHPWERSFQTQNKKSSENSSLKYPYGRRCPGNFQTPMVRDEGRETNDFIPLSSTGHGTLQTNSRRSSYQVSPASLETKGYLKNSAENFQSGVKRQLQEANASYNTQQTKQAKLVPSKPFSSACDNSLKVAIKNDNSPKGIMLEWQATLLGNHLLKIIDQESFSYNGHIPRFFDSNYSQGVLKITCADQTTLDWLRRTVANLREFAGGAKFSVVSLEELFVKRIQASFLLSGSTEDPSITLQRIERQNPELKTRAWKILQYKEVDGKGRLTYLQIDESSVETLRKMDFKPFLGLSRITINVSGCNPKRKRGKKAKIAQE